MAWWKEYSQFQGLEESPLSIRRHDFLVGHDSVLTFSNRAIEGGTIVMIVGPAGIGKSAIAKHLARTITGRRVVVMNAKKYSGEPFALKRYLRRSIFSLPGRPTCLLVDEANLLIPTMIDRIFYYYDEAAQEKKGIQSIILFQVDPELRNASLPNRSRIAAVHAVDGTSTQDVMDIIKRRLCHADAVSDEALRAIVLREGSNPRNALLRLDLILETKRKRIELHDVDEIYTQDHGRVIEEADPPLRLDDARLSRLELPFHLSDLQHTIVKHLLLAGSRSVGSIAESIGNPYGSVGKQLHLLHRRGIVMKKNQNRPVVYLLAKSAKDALMTD